MEEATELAGYLPLSKRYRTLVPEYVKDDVSLNQFVA